MKSLLAIAAVLAMALPAVAQTPPPRPTYQNQLGTVTPLPMALTPLCPGSHGVTISTAAGLVLPRGVAVAGVCTTTKPPVTPTYCVVCARTATVTYTLDGSTPTTSNGTPLAASSCLLLTSNPMILAFQAISASGTLDQECAQ